MKVTQPELEGVILIELDIHRDTRGFFIERFHSARFREFGLPTHFMQDNHSRSAPGVLRGLHYQHTPPLGKLVGVVHGRVWVAVVDIRTHSPTFGQHLGLELSDEDGRMLWVPAGFAHGMCVLGNEPVDFLLKTDAFYNAAGEGGIFWADPDLSIPWPVQHPIISARDERLPSFADYRSHPIRWDVGRERALSSGMHRT